MVLQNTPRGVFCFVHHGKILSMTIFNYIISLIVLVALDSTWLFSMGAKYKTWLKPLFTENVSFLPVVFFYLVYAFGLIFFIISPALKQGQSLCYVFLAGALLGFIVYAAYDLTNQATLRDWPLIVSIVDMAWGTILTGVSSVIIISIINYFK